MRRIVLGLALGVVLGVCAVRVLSASAPTEKLKPGNVLTGEDLGFRVEKVENYHIVGYFVVRVNGEWTATEEPAPHPRVVPAKP
jgi:hypothetical protein